MIDILKKIRAKLQLFGLAMIQLIQKKYSYKELHQNVCKAANGLKSLGIQKGDRVTIYLNNDT